MADKRTKSRRTRSKPKPVGRVEGEQLSEARARYAIWQQTIGDAAHARAVEQLVGEAFVQFVADMIREHVGPEEDGSRFKLDLETGEFFEPERIIEEVRLSG